MTIRSSLYCVVRWFALFEVHESIISYCLSVVCGVLSVVGHCFMYCSMIIIINYVLDMFPPTHITVCWVLFALKQLMYFWIKKKTRTHLYKQDFSKVHTSLRAAYGALQVLLLIDLKHYSYVLYFLWLVLYWLSFVRCLLHVNWAVLLIHCKLSTSCDQCCVDYPL